MNDIILNKNVRLADTVIPPVSKSELHRALFCAALGNRNCLIRFNGSYSDDIQATLDCLSALGAIYTVDSNGITIQPINSEEIPDSTLLDCRESATTLRFILPVVAALGIPDAKIKRRGSLLRRPICSLELLGISSENGVITVSNRLLPGNYKVEANVTSQTVSGMLIALAYLSGDSSLSLTDNAVSAPYIDMTVGTLSDFGVEVSHNENTYTIRGGQRINAPTVYTVGGDWSCAAFALCAGLIANKRVSITGLDNSSRQGDRLIGDIVKSFPLPFKFNAVNNPDLVPPLAALACFMEGESEIYSAARLVGKESDRLKALTDALNALGADIRRTDDGLIIRGKKYLNGGVADSCGDHRIAMAAGIASLGCKESVTVLGASCVEKSWKGFWNIFL